MSTLTDSIDNEELFNQIFNEKYLIRPEWKIVRGYFYRSTGELFDDATCDQLEEWTRIWENELEEYHRAANSPDPYKLKLFMEILSSRPTPPTSSRQHLDKDRIKEEVLPSTVIGAYTQLIPTSGHTFKASCPFHKDRTPSLSINDDKRVWYCFSCNQSGDIFSFLMVAENCTFKEALEIADSYR